MNENQTQTNHSRVHLFLSCLIAFILYSTLQAQTSTSLNKPFFKTDTNVSRFQPLKAEFTASKSTMIAGSEVVFRDISKGIPQSWTWIINGGIPNKSKSQNPISTFKTPGEYEVFLVVSDSWNQTDTFSILTNGHNHL